MFGDETEINADKKSVSGPLMAAGEYTGVNLEVRAGGPAIGFSTVSSQMYQDDSITLGYVTTDEAIQLSGTTPTTAVFAPLDKSPIMVMWDPETYTSVSDVTDLSDQLKASGGVWRYFADSAYMAYLIGSGQVDESVTDSSYDGTPANFVAADGKDVQQGFASAEPYQYENEVTDWGKKVDYSLVADAGYERLRVGCLCPQRRPGWPLRLPEGLRAGPAAGRGRLLRRPRRRELADPRPRRPVRHRLGLQPGPRRLLGEDHDRPRSSSATAATTPSATSTPTACRSCSTPPVPIFTDGGAEIAIRTHRRRHLHQRVHRRFDRPQVADRQSPATHAAPAAPASG